MWVQSGRETSRSCCAPFTAPCYSEQYPADAYRIMEGREGITPAEFADALTNGIKVLSEADQADYLKPGGKVATVIDASDRILRQSRQLTNPDRRTGIVNSSFATAK